MIQGEHYKKLTHKAAHILATANNIRWHKQNATIVFKLVLEKTAILGHTENFSGTRIIIGQDGTYLLGAEHLLLDKFWLHISEEEQQFAISIKKLIEGYEKGIRTEYTNLGFINIFPNWWDTIILGTNDNDTLTVWQHGKPLSQPNLYLKYDKANPNMINNIIQQIQNTHIWKYNIIDKNTTLHQARTFIENYKNEISNRFQEQEFIENDYAANNITKYPPHMLIIKETYPIFDVKKYETEEEMNLKYRTLNALSHLAINTPNSGISILMYTKYPQKAVIPQNVSMHFSTINEIRNLVF